MDAAHSASDRCVSTEAKVQSAVSINPSNQSGSRSSGGGGGGGGGRGGETGGSSHQSRARITVVCQECKRQKLKCDRKTPCGSCVKRATLGRCLYSAAAAEKVDLHSVNNRTTDLESFVGSLSRGVPLQFLLLQPYIPSYPLSAQAVEDNVVAYNAAVADGTFPRPSSSAAGLSGHHHHHPAAATGSHQFFLSGLNDSAHDYAHILAGLEGVTLDENMCSCCTCGTRFHERQEGFLNINEEPRWRHDDSDEILPPSSPSMMPGPSNSKSTAKSIPSSRPHLSTLESQQLQQSVLHFLPPLNIYYQEPPIPLPGSSSASSGPFPPVPGTPTSDFIPNRTNFTSPVNAPLFYSSTPGPLHAHAHQALGTFSLKDPLSVAETPLGLRSPSMGPPQPPALERQTASLQPSVTPAVIDLLPPTATSTRYLRTAKDVLIAWPVEMGFPAGMAAWPKDLKQKMKDFPAGLLGWEAFFRRSKRLYSRKDPSKVNPSSVSSSSRSKSKGNSPDAAAVAPPASGSGSTRGKEKSSSTSNKKRTLQDSEVERMKQIYLSGALGHSRGAISEPHIDANPDVAVLEQHVDVRRMNQIRTERAKSKRSPTLSSHSSPSSNRDSAVRSGKSRMKESVSSPPPSENLPFFALLCALMAVGASNEVEVNMDIPDEPVSPNSTSPAFLYALSQQALGIWMDGGEPLPAAGSSSDEMVKEARTDYLRACLVGLRFLMGEVTGASLSLATKQCKNRGNPNRRAILSLIGKMVSALRTWGFEAGLLSESDSPEDAESEASDAPAKSSKKASYSEDQQARGMTDQVTEENEVKVLIEKIRRRESEEARKRVFWDVLYYDLFVADSFGEPPLVPASCYSAPLPLIAPEFHCDAQEHEEMMVDEHGNADHPRNSDDVRKQALLEAERLRLERLYLVSRAQITRLAYEIKQQTSSSDCCGYTLDQATKLETEVKTWMKGVPEEFRLAFRHGVVGNSSELISMGKTVLSELIDDDESPEQVRASKREDSLKPREDDGSRTYKWLKMTIAGNQEYEDEEIDSTVNAPSEETSTRILGCELALMVELLLFKIYSPFTSSFEAERSTTVKASSVAVALQHVATSSQAIIRLSKILSGLLEIPFMTGLLSIPIPRPIKSPLLTTSSLEGFIFDSTLVCARIAFKSGVDGPETDTAGMNHLDAGRNEMMQSIGIGIDLLERVCGLQKRRKNPTSSSTLRTDRSVTSRIVASLRRQWIAKISSLAPPERLKRTRSAMEDDISPRSSLPEPDPLAEDDQDQDDDDSVVCQQDKDEWDREDPGASPPAQVALPYPQHPPGSEVDHQRPNQPRRATKDSLATLLKEKAPIEKEKKKRGESVSSTASIDALVDRPTFGVRARTKGGEMGKRKIEIPKMAPAPQPLLTSVPRTINKDGKLGYAEEPQSRGHVSPRSQAQPRPQHESHRYSTPAPPPPETQRFYSGMSKPSFDMMTSMGALPSIELSYHPNLPQPSYNTHSHTGDYSTTYHPEMMAAMGSMQPLTSPHLYHNDPGEYANYPSTHNFDTTYDHSVPHPDFNQPPTPSSAVPSDGYFGHSMPPAHPSSYTEQNILYGPPMGVDNDNLVEQGHSSYDLSQSPHQQATYSMPMAGHVNSSSSYAEAPDPGQTQSQFPWGPAPGW